MQEYGILYDLSIKFQLFQVPNQNKSINFVIKQYTGSDENELCGTASDNRNIIPVPKNTITEDVGDTMVCSPVGNLPISTPVPVHEQINNFMTSSTSTGIEYTIVQKTDNYDSILEEDMIVDSPVGFFFDMEHDNNSFSDNISNSSIETNDISTNKTA